MFGGPRLPLGQLCVQALSPFTDESENRFAPGLGSGRPVKSLFGSLAVVTPGEAPVTAEFGERILGRFSFLASLGQFEEGPLLVLLERRYGVEGRLGSLVDDGVPA